MFTIKPAWIERDGKRTHAVVTIDEWRQVEELLEDLKDIRDAERILSDPHDEPIPAELAHRIFQGTPPIRVFREARGLTQAQLAEAAGIDPALVAAVEQDEGAGSVELMHKLAEVLGVKPDTLTGWS